MYHSGRQNATLPADLSIPMLSLGTTMIGTWLGWAFTGFNIFSVLYFFQRFPQEGWLNRGTVVFLVATEVFYTCTKSWQSYEWGVYNFGNVDNLFVFPQGEVPGVILGCIITLCVQWTFARRAYHISKLSSARSAGQWWAPAIIVLFSLVSAGFGAGFAAIVYIYDGDELQLAAHYLTGIKVWLATSAATDVVITLILTFFLVRARTDFEATNNLLTKMLLMAAETNALTMIIAIVMIITLNRIALGTEELLYDLLAHFYCISLLATLTWTRPPKWAGGESVTVTGSLPPSTMGGGTELRSRGRGQQFANSQQQYGSSPAGAVNVHTVTYTGSDDDALEKGRSPYAGPGEPVLSYGQDKSSYRY